MAEAKKIKFSYEGRDYILEYTRESVKKMERGGFIIGNVQDRPMTLLPELFNGAFIANHPFVKDPVKKNIFSHMTNKEALYSKLIEMYNATMESLFDEPEEGAEGNVNWEEME